MFVYVFASQTNESAKKGAKTFSLTTAFYTCYCLLFSFCGFSVFNNAHHILSRSYIAINTCNNIYISLCVVIVVTAAFVVAVFAIAVAVAISIKFDVFNIFVCAGFSFDLIWFQFLNTIYHLKPLFMGAWVWERSLNFHALSLSHPQEYYIHDI